MDAAETETAVPTGIGNGGEFGKAGSKSKPNDTPTGPTRQRLWQDRNPVARWSHLAVASAIRRGILIKPERCEKCNEPRPLDAHHADHRLALDVKWWCRPCHARHHAGLRRQEGGGDG